MRLYYILKFSSGHLIVEIPYPKLQFTISNSKYMTFDKKKCLTFLQTICSTSILHSMLKIKLYFLKGLHNNLGFMLKMGLSKKKNWKYIKWNSAKIGPFSTFFCPLWAESSRMTQRNVRFGIEYHCVHFAKPHVSNK